MSDFRAIATVTQALITRLDEQAKDPFTGINVTAAAPDAASKGALPAISVFLYQVSPNAALRNADLPARGAGGELVQRPRAAVDLHYLITTHGELFEPQFLLGIVIRTLHAFPLLTRQEINAASILTGSAFGDEVDLVKFTPNPLSLDELSKLWSLFFQPKYALSVTYNASVIFIEGSEAAAPALPVREHRVRVLPSLGPMIERLASSTPADPVPREDRPLVMGDTLHIFGRSLRGDGTRVRIGATLVTPTAVANDEITILLNDPALRAGIAAVQVVHDVDFGALSGMHGAFESNVVPFVLAPHFTPGPLTATAFTLSIQPDVAVGQQLVLLLNGSNRSYRFSALAAQTSATQTIPLQGVHSGTYLVRLQVDGATSALELDSGGQYIRPAVTV